MPRSLSRPAPRAEADAIITVLPMHVTAIIAAAGAGRRVGAVKPKQLIDIGGGSMLLHSLNAFLRHPRISEVVVVLPREQSRLVLGATHDPAALPPIRVVTGGERRQDSVANGFDAVSAQTD